MSGNLNYIKSLQKSLAEMKKRQKQQDRKIKSLERELKKKEKEDQKREKARIRQNNREDMKRRKESQKNLRKLMKTRGYWNKESNRRAKEQFENENKVEILHSKNNFKEYRIKNLFSKTIEEFLSKVRDKVLPVLSINKKVFYVLTVTMEKGVVEEGKKRQKKTTRNHHLRPPIPSVILDENDKEKSFDSLNEKFNDRLVDLETTESGWTLKSIDNLDIKVVRYNPLAGGCILHNLPKELEGKKCLIQMSSRDNRCFQDSIHLLYDPPDKNKNIPLKIKSPFDWSDVSFPVCEKDIEKFERNNPNILVYVYGYDKDFYIFYKNKDFYSLSVKSRVFHLLFYKNHYYPIVNLKAFHKIIMFVCRVWLTFQEKRI